MAKYLLKENETSCFHRLKSDEIWVYFDGSAILINIIDMQGNYRTEMVGNPIL